MLARVTARAPGHACVSPVSSRVMHMWVWLPGRFYQRDLLLTGRVGVSSWPSHHALSAGPLECLGMWARTGGEVPLRDSHPRHNPSPPLHSPSHSRSLSGFPRPSSEEWISGNFHLLFSPRRRKGGRQTGGTGWFNTRLRVQTLPFIFLLLAIFFLCLINWVWTPLSPNMERYSHSSADGLLDGFRGGKKIKSMSGPTAGSFSQPHQTVRRVFLSRLNWKKAASNRAEYNGEKKALLSAYLIPHPPTTYFPSFRLLSALRLLLPVETWSCLGSQFYVSYVPEWRVRPNYYY